MDKPQLQKIFSAPYDHNSWIEVLTQVFGARQLLLQPKPILLPSNDISEGAFELGSIITSDDRLIGLYKIDVKSNVWLERNKVGLRKLLRNVYKYDVDGALIVFVQQSKWRFSFVSEIRTEDGKQETEPKRYTYLFGEGESCKTAAERFDLLIDNPIKIQDLFDAFNVEKLNKSFFEGYQKQYEKFVLYLTGETWKKKQNKFELIEIQDPSPLLKSAFYGNKKSARDFCKKLLGRIVFLHFLQKKRWLGCPIDDGKWENGRQQFMFELFNGFNDKDKFHSVCLTELFFNTLNKPDREDIFKVIGLQNELNGSKVPYLNGGLFEVDNNCDPFKIDFPESYFRDLLDFFSQYNFTIDENSLIDHEIGIDPEMLGHIFENLLEENREKGAFYTPKEIVQYMTQESLIQYLKTHLGEQEELERFIRNNEVGDRHAKHNFIRDNASKIEDLLDKVKICDPAIGSGAFPMGILTEIFEAKMTLDMTLDRSDVKKKIIQNSIYGVDLDSGAVDIARLRFWLALVVDEDTPHALPNLDYKIMQGNSLLESFEGIDLSRIHEGKAIRIDDRAKSDNLFSKVLLVEEIEDNNEKLEDLIETYFDLDNPVKKHEQHKEIDKQVLGKIYQCLYDEYKLIDQELKKINRLMADTAKSLTTVEQKIKYETISKDAKHAKLLKIKKEGIDDKLLKFKELYESNDRPFFLWHLIFKDVFDRGGFDIVIGNPPWGAQIAKETLSYIKSKNNDIVKRMIDSFMFFINESLSLTKEKGVISKIVPEVLLNQQDNVLLREKILRVTTIKSIANLGDNIFEGVTRASCIIQLINEKHPSSNYEVVDFIKSKAGIRFLYSGKNVSTSLLNSLPNTIFPTQNLNLYKTLELIISNHPDILLDLLDEDGIQRGVSPDLKEAFLPTESDVKEFNLEKKHIKNTVTGGKDINRYGFLFPNKQIIYTSKSTPVSEIKNIINYIKRYEAEITCKEVKEGKHPFYVLHRTRNEKIFDKKSKILGVVTGDKISVAIDFDRIYPTDGIYLMSTGSISLDKALVGILNSKLITIIYRLFSNEKGKILAQVKPTILENIPIPKLNDVEVNLLDTFVSMIIHLIKLSNQEEVPIDNKDIVIQQFERIIDGIIYELYFKDHMYARGINVIEFLNTDITLEINSNYFDDLNEMKKNEIIISLFSRWNEPNNVVRNNIQLFAIKSPEILKPIMESYENRVY